MGVNKPDRFEMGDLPKMLAPRLNQIKSGIRRFTRERIAWRAVNELGCQQYSITVLPR
jgi:hypothetical protein